MQSTYDPVKIRQKLLRYLHVPEKECEYFVHDMTGLLLKKKDYFIMQNKLCDTLAFVNKGVLRMYYVTAQGKEVNVKFFFENDFVTSYQSFLNRQPSKYNIQALKECDLSVVQWSNLEHAYQNSAFWNKVGRIIAERSFMQAERYTENLLFYGAQERYERFLKDNPKALKEVPLYHIASYLGIERESLSRIRKTLSKIRL